MSMYDNDREDERAKKKQAQEQFIFDQWLPAHQAVQRKKNAAEGPAIDDPGDKYEREADRIAKNVVSRHNTEPAQENISPASISPQRKEEDTQLMAKSEGGAMHGTEQLQAKLDSSKGSGQSLDDHTKSEMESKMNADLGDVKIHTDAKAHEMSEGLNAKAFTHGQDIYFKQGNFDTKSNTGKELLTHELVHTQQQKGGVERKVQRNPDYKKTDTNPGEQSNGGGNLGDPKGITAFIDINGDQYRDTNVNIKKEGTALAISIDSILSKEKRGPFIFQMGKELPDDTYLSFDTIIATQEYGLASRYMLMSPSDKSVSYIFAIAYLNDPEKPNRYGILLGDQAQDLQLDHKKLSVDPELNTGYNATDAFDPTVTMMMGPFGEVYDFKFIEKYNDLRATYDDKVRDKKNRPVEMQLQVLAKDEYGNIAYGAPYFIQLKKQITLNSIQKPETNQNHVDLDLDGDKEMDIQVYHYITPLGQNANIREDHIIHLVVFGPAIIGGRAEIYFKKRGGKLQFKNGLTKEQYYTLTGTLAEENIRQQTNKFYGYDEDAFVVFGEKKKDNERTLSSVQTEIMRLDVGIEYYRQQAADKGYINRDTYAAWKQLQASFPMLIPFMESDPAKQPSGYDEVTRKSIMKTVSDRAREFYALFKEETKDQFHIVSEEYTNYGKQKKKKANEYTGQTYTVTGKDKPHKRKKEKEIVLAYDIMKELWSDVMDDYKQLQQGYDQWMMDSVPTDEAHKEEKASLQNTLDTRQQLANIKDKKHLTKVFAVYYPYVEEKVSSGQPATEMAIPLPVYYYLENNSWRIIDLVNPQKPFKAEVEYKPAHATADGAEPPKELFDQLDHSDHLPEGIIHYHVQDGPHGSVKMTEPMTPGAIMRYIGTGLAVGSLIVLSGGTATGPALAWGTYMFAASAAATITGVALDANDKAKHGQLDEVTMVLYGIDILTAFLDLNIAGFMRVSTQGVKWPRLAAMSDHVAMTLTKTTIGLQGARLVIFSADTAYKIKQIADGPGSRERKTEAIAMLLGQAALSLGVYVIALRGPKEDLDSFSQSRQLTFKEGPDGQPMVNTISAEAVSLPLPQGMPVRLVQEERDIMIALLGKKRVDELDNVMLKMNKEADDLVNVYGTINAYHALNATNGNITRASRLLHTNASIAAKTIAAKYPVFEPLTEIERITLSRFDDDALKILSTKSPEEIKKVIALAKEQGVEQVNRAIKTIAFTEASDLSKVLTRVSTYNSAIENSIPMTTTFTWDDVTFTIETKPPDVSGKIRITTTVTDLKTNSIGYAIRVYDPNKQTYELTDFALNNVRSKIKAPQVSLKDGVVPTMLVIHLHQLKQLGVKSGSIDKFIMRTITNESTMLHLSWLKKIYPDKDINELIKFTDSFLYAQTIITQSGHSIRSVKVDIPIHGQFKVGTRYDQKLLDSKYPGLNVTDDCFEGFDIIFVTTPR